jgi:hypothetical protein
MVVSIKKNPSWPADLIDLAWPIQNMTLNPFLFCKKKISQNIFVSFFL